jgi:hypothetical protein
MSSRRAPNGIPADVLAATAGARSSLDVTVSAAVMAFLVPRMGLSMPGSAAYGDDFRDV